MIRGIRGATSIDENSKEEIVAKTEELLNKLIERNRFAVADVASAILSVTDDIDAEFPAVAARRLGWISTPLLCTREIPVAGSLQGIIRVLLHVNTDKRQEDIIHVYLYEAKKLRPDLDTDDRDKYYISDK